MTTNTYDLSAVVFKYLTPRLIAPLLEILQNQKVYPEDFCVKQRYAVLTKTNNFSALLSLLEKYPSLLPQDKKSHFEQSKIQFESKIAAAKEPLGADLYNYIVEVSQLTTRDLQNIKRDSITSRLTITTPQLTALQQFASLSVETGDYLIGAIAYFILFLIVEGFAAGPHALTKESLWVMVEAALLCGNHHMAIYDPLIRKLRELIDSTAANTTLSTQTQQRVSYLAFSLFAFTTNPPQNALLAQRSVWSDMIYSQPLPGSTTNMHNYNERCLNALLFETPELLRYVAISTIIAARVPLSVTAPWLLKKSAYFRELARVIQVQYPSTDSENQTDPIIRFIQQALIEFDVPAAIDTLNNQVTKVFDIDPFLSSPTLKLDFFEAAKAILIDTILKLNTNITLPRLRAMLPLNITCEGFDNTITLPAPVEAGKPKDTKDNKEATVAPEAASEVHTEEAPDEDAQIDVVMPTETAVYIAPSLAKTSFQSRLMKLKAGLKK
jgi:hypothetical protein